MPTLRFAQLPPICKIGAWLLLTLALAAAVQGPASLLGLPFNVFTGEGGGRGLMLALALGSLLLVMGADQRPLSDFGLFIGPSWKRHWFGGLGLGIASCGLYVLAALLTGAYDLAPQAVSAGGMGKSVLKGMTALPLSITQQILFSGYLLSMLRDRHHRLAAVAGAAALFALLGRLDQPHLLLTPPMLAMMFSLFLVAALLGMARLATGSILLSAGLLGGWMFTRRVLEGSGLVTVDPTSVFTPWLAPGGDTRNAPFMWLLLGVGIAWCQWRLMRRGEGVVAGDAAAIDADFKRVVPLGHSGLLLPLDVWLGRLWHARFAIGWCYLPRLAVVLAASACNTLLSLPERLLLPLLLRKKVADPVFILGVHRSGTTHLHNLMALDPQFCTPRMYQVLNPIGFLFSGWLITPLLGLFMPWRRPMDAVRSHIFTPQEEEFALAGVFPLSPSWGMTFPRLWPEYDRLIRPDDWTPRERAAWTRHFLLFLRKLAFWSGKRPLLKNPYNTARLALLAELFPEARFVHIHRDPFTVYRSNAHLEREGHVLNQLQDPLPEQSYTARFLENYRLMEDTFYRDAASAAPGTVTELPFEELEADPIAQLRRVYAELGLEFTPRFEARLREYLAGLGEYRKNRHRPVAADLRRRIEAAMGPYLRQWGYESPPVAEEEPLAPPRDRAA